MPQLRVMALLSPLRKERKLILTLMLDVIIVCLKAISAVTVEAVEKEVTNHLSLKMLLWVGQLWITAPTIQEKRNAKVPIPEEWPTSEEEEEVVQAPVSLRRIEIPID